MTNSWIIQNNSTGEVFETYSRKNIEAYESISHLSVYTAREWLEKLNREIKQGIQK